MNVHPSRTRASAGRALLPALALVAAVLVTGCGEATGSDAGGSAVATSTVDLPKSYRFAPEAITVPVGATVTWTNSDNFTHNVAFEGEAPLVMSPGQSVTRTFDTAGAYAYVCSLHTTNMKGSVTVTNG